MTRPDRLSPERAALSVGFIGPRAAILACLALALADWGTASAAPPRPTILPGCAPAPTLGLAAGLADRRHAFASGTAASRRLAARFAAAYRGACAHGLLRRRPLIAAGAAEQGRLLLRNAPDANIASIYLDGEEGAPGAARHMVLEYPFLTADGATHLPSEAELGEAIFCAVQGASEQEQEASGRCLPD